MKFTVAREILLKALDRVQGLADRKQVGKTSGCLQITALGEAVRIAATDGDIYTVQDLNQVEVATDGQVIVTAKVLHDIVRCAQVGAKLKLDLREKTLLISYGDAKFNLNFLTDGAFPPAPELNNSHQLTLNSSLLARLFKQVGFAASKDKLCRPFLCGVNLNFSTDQLVALATDGFRLARKRITASTPKSSEAVPSVIVPTKAVSEAMKLLEEADQDVSLAFDRHLLSLTLPNLQLYARLVDANYPDCDAIFPAEDSRHNLLTIDDVSSLLTVVERISSVSLEKREPLRVELSKEGLMTISTMDRATGSAEERLAVTYQGESTVIGVNSRYLIDILKCLLSNKALLLPGKANEPILIKDKADHNLEYLLMPMQT